MRIHISIILSSLLIIGCVSNDSLNHNEHKIVHIVLIWLHDPGNQNHIDKVIKVTQDLLEITEVLEIRVGESISSDRPIVDDSFDIALYMIFNSKEELQAYLVHPKHKEAVKTVLRPLANKILVYDFKDIGR